MKPTLCSILIAAASLLFGCASSPKADRDAISAYFQKRLTIEEAEKEITRLFDLNKIDSELANESDPKTRAALTEERKVYSRHRAESLKKLESQAGTFNAETDQIWTYYKAPNHSAHRCGESGIVLLQKNKITYLHRIILD